MTIGTDRGQGPPPPSSCAEVEDDTLERVFREVNSAHLRTWIPEDSPRFLHALNFSLSRLTAGRRMVRHLERRHRDRLPPRGRVLDLGSGNGGLSFPWAQSGYRCLCLELFAHPEQREVARKTGLSLDSLAARAERLPLANASIDLVLYAEVIEHLEDACAAGREIVRVLRPGGLCLITTPPRLRFLLRRDPHCRVPGLLLLPQGLQKWVVERLLRRSRHYDVVHTYVSVGEVLSTLPGLGLLEVTGPLSGTPLRRLDWEWIIAERSPHPGSLQRKALT